MKRVKMMLTGVAVLAVVGGALAFKAQNFSQRFIYTTPDASGFCTIKLTSARITNVDPLTPKIFAATTNNVVCQETWTQVVADN